MPRKSYQQHCGVARALDVVGERWTLLLVRSLLLGPKRYSDLLGELPGITTNLLAKRVQELEALQILCKEPAALGATVYRLTEAGLELEPVVMELGRWGFRFMGAPSRADTVNVGWALLSLKRRYKGGLSCTVLVVADERRFTLGFGPTAMTVEERSVTEPAVSISGDVGAILALFFSGAPWARAERAGQVVISGSKALTRELEHAFEPLPSAMRVAAKPAQRRKTTRRKLSSKNSSVSSKREV